MSRSIDTIRNILHNQIGDGRRRLNCVVEPNTQSAKDLIMLFYVPDVKTPIALGVKTSKGYYSRVVNCAVRHKVQEKAEDIAFQALELLGKNRRTPGTSLFFDDTPTYKGKDDRNGGYIYSFNFITRGNK